MGIEKGEAAVEKIRVLFTFGKSVTDYAEAIHRLEEAEDCIRQMIDPLGFSAGDLKTTRIRNDSENYWMHWQFVRWNRYLRSFILWDKMKTRITDVSIDSRYVMDDFLRYEEYLRTTRNRIIMNSMNLQNSCSVPTST